jgi:hypothetical protein
MMNLKMNRLNKKGTERRLSGMTTYSLLVRSEDRSRGILETAIYLLVALSVVVSIWQFAQQTDRLQTDGAPKPPVIAVADSPPAGS